MWITIDDIDEEMAEIFSTRQVNALGIYSSTSTAIIEVDGQEVSVKQDLNAQTRAGVTGGVVWSSTTNLIPRILQNFDFRNKTILELGSGTGVAGLMIRDCTFIASDHDPALLRLIARNLKLRKDTRIVEIDWTFPMSSYLSNLDAVNYILCLDCIYSSFLVRHLVATLDALANHFNARVIIGQQLRDATVHSEFLTLVAPHYKIQKWVGLEGYVLMILDRV